LIYVIFSLKDHAAPIYMISKTIDKKFMYLGASTIIIAISAEIYQQIVVCCLSMVNLKKVFQESQIVG